MIELYKQTVRKHDKQTERKYFPKLHTFLYFLKILLEFFETPINWSIFITFIVGIGTLIYPYSIVFNK